MLNTTAAFQNAVNSQHSLKPRIQLFAEWNHNRYGPSLQTWSNQKSIDEDYFPLESVNYPNRPKSGNPIFIGRGRVTNDEARYRWRVTGKDAQYRYWATHIFGSRRVRTHVSTTYGELMPTNKIFVTFETGRADSTVGWPTNVSFQVTTNGTSWSTVYTGSLQDIENGTLELWWNGTDWQQEEFLGAETQIYGVRIYVNTVRYIHRSVQMIELGAGLKLNITDRVSNIHTNRIREDMDAQLPIAAFEANSCELSLDNTDRLFDPLNDGSPYHRLIDENTKLVPYFGYEINGQDEFVPAGVYYVDTWMQRSDQAAIEVRARDFSKFLQEQDVPVSLFVNRRAAVVVSEILAKIGFTDTVWNMVDNEYAIPYIWFKDEETVWEALNSVAKADQGVFYFDEWGLFNYETKSAIFEHNTVDYELVEESSGTQLSNIENVSNEFDVSANKVQVRYEPLTANYDRDRIPIYSGLWEPSENIALQASALRGNLGTSSNILRMDPEVVSLMPYSGYVELNGEIIKYTGKSYRYYWSSRGSSYRTRIVTSQEEKEQYDDASHPFHMYKNHFTGTLHNLERGQFQSPIKTHYANTISPRWIKRRFTQGGSLQVSNNLVDVVDARARLELPRGSGYNEWNIMYRGTHGTVMHHYGTNVKFEEGYSHIHGIAGLATHLYSSGGVFRGYFFELVLSDFVNNVALGSMGSVRAYRMDRNGVRRGLPNTETGRRGYELPIVKGREYEIEVSYHQKSREWSMFLDGEHITSFADLYGSRYNSGRFGVYVRGHTRAHFDYFYATDAETVPYKKDMTNWVNL